DRELESDIERRKKIEKALRESEENFRQLTENIDQVFWLTDWKNKKLIYVSPSYEKVYGRSVQSAYDDLMSWQKSIHPDDYERVAEIFAESAREEKYVEAEYRIKTSAGNEKWVFDRSYPIKDDKGNVYRFVSIAEDITDRKLAEEKLQKSEERLQKAQEIANIGNFEWNFQTGETFWSEQLFKIHGRKPENGPPSYKEFLRHIHPDDRKAVKMNLKTALKTGEFSNEYRTRRYDNNELRYLAGVGRIKYDKNKKPLILQATEQDITDRKKAEKELEKYRKHLEDLVKERTKKLEETQQELIAKQQLATIGKFAGGLSHEIRNPLAVIDSSAYTLEQKDYTDEFLRKHLKRIREAVKKSDQVINSIRRLTQKRGPQLKKLLLNDLLIKLERKMNLPSGINFVLNLPEEKIWIKGDRIQLNICFDNLLQNAMDAIEETGEISIKLQKIDSEKCKITVIDTGLGIKPDYINKIFEPLFSSKSFGIGFGLSLVKKIVESHHGVINVESEPGLSTKFTILLPIFNKEHNNVL
ncbi:MAG: PAS domain-containing protein, partial [Candidatus Cloacimonetes bacterium]|nr:PAS domain-containing protein [Candidatus Cloacimonadota bacterium]